MEILEDRHDLNNVVHSHGCVRTRWEVIVHILYGILLLLSCGSWFRVGQRGNKPQPTAARGLCIKLFFQARGHHFFCLFLCGSPEESRVTGVTSVQLPLK